jgi:hypothetical protein
MGRYLKVLTVVLAVLLAVLLAGVQTLQAQPRKAPLPPPRLAPQWAPVARAPGVDYAPNLDHDLFRYGNQFYYFSQGVWQIARALSGPWQVIQSPPPAFYNIEANYFRSPPGWAKGKKTGWRGAPMPPGQMKKFEGGNMPPGQRKKFERDGNLPPGQMKKYD